MNAFFLRKHSHSICSLCRELVEQLLSRLLTGSLCVWEQNKCVLFACVCQLPVWSTTEGFVSLSSHGNHTCTCWLKRQRDSVCSAMTEKCSRVGLVEMKTSKERLALMDRSMSCVKHHNYERNIFPFQERCAKMPFFER